MTTVRSECLYEMNVWNHTQTLVRFPALQFNQRSVNVIHTRNVSLECQRHLLIPFAIVS